MTKNGIVKSWLQSNLWNLVITFVSIILAFSALQLKVALQEQKIEALEKRVATYPSQDYFELRFKQLDASINDIKIDLKAKIDR